MQRRAKLVYDGDVKLYQVDKAIIPFSFGNSIFINQQQHSEVLERLAQGVRQLRSRTVLEANARDGVWLDHRVSQFDYPDPEPPDRIPDVQGHQLRGAGLLVQNAGSGGDERLLRTGGHQR